MHAFDKLYGLRRAFLHFGMLSKLKDAAETKQARQLSSRQARSHFREDRPQAVLQSVTLEGEDGVHAEGELISFVVLK